MNGASPTLRIGYVGGLMPSAKQEATSLLGRLSDDSSLEDVRYHLYVTEKVRRGLYRAETEGVSTQMQAEERLGKWLINQ